MFVACMVILGVSVVRVLPQELLTSQVPLYGLAEVAAKALNSSECGARLKTLYYAVRKRETWALGMLDSSGSPGGGLLRGPWLGSYSRCRQTFSEMPASTSMPDFAPAYVKRAPFAVDFYVASFSRNFSFRGREGPEPEDGVRLGLCLPSTCSAEDLRGLLHFWADRRPLSVQALYDFSLVFRKVRRLRFDFSWTSSSLFVCLSVAAGVAVLLTVSGTIYDVYGWKPHRKKKSIEYRENDKGVELANVRNIREYSELLFQDNNLNQCHEFKVDNSQHKSIPVHVAKHQDASEGAEAREPSPSAYARLSLCFSAAANAKKIFRASKDGDEANLVHGLRFFATVWLIWLYTGFFLRRLTDPDAEPLAGPRLSSGFSDLVVADSTFSVDTFFFASGYLLAFKYYKDRRGARKTDRDFSVKKKVNEFGSVVVRRFLRLSPLYAVVIGAAVILTKSSRESSLFDDQEPVDEICRKFWWRNMVYLNNLFKGEEMCLSWSWYLSMDMQFFLLGTFILILSSRFWKLASFVGVFLVFLSSAIAGYLFYGHIHGHFSPSRTSPSLFRALHYSPWTRIGPYLIGMFTGYFVVRSKGKLPAKKATLVTCWLMWLLCVVWALFGLCGENTSPLSAALHAALSRTAWAFGLSWIVTACCTGQAGAAKAILSYRGWIPFGKLSYSAYLLTPLVISSIVFDARNVTPLDFSQMVVYFFGHSNIIYFSAFIISLLLEIPLGTLGSQLFGKVQTQNQLNEGP